MARLSNLSRIVSRTAPCTASKAGTRTVLFALLAVLLFAATFAIYPYTRSASTRTALAATNNTINFQARILQASGAVVPDGSYNVQFKLYDGGTQGGPAGQGPANAGSLLWTETYQNSNSQGIVVRNGYITASLGSITAFPGIINWDQQLWITMNIGGTSTGASPTYDGEMLQTGNKRMALTAVPYAFKAGQLAQFNNATGFTSTLSLVQPTGGSQVFSLPDLGAATSATVITTGNLSGITAVGTVASGTWQGTAITGAYGGTGQTTTTIGDLLLGAAGNTWSKLAIGGTGTCLTSNGTTASWGSCGAGGGGTLQGAYTASTGGTTPEIKVDTTRGALDIQDADTSIAGSLLTVRASNSSGLGTALFDINSTGQTMFKNSSNSTTAFQIQNASAANILNVDTTASLNLITNNDFESGTTGWAAKGATTISQTTAHRWQGNASLSVAMTAAADDGASYAYNLAPSTTYTFSLYAKVASGSITDFAYGNQDITGTDIDCATGIVLTTVWTRVSCSFTTGATISGSNIYVKKTGTSAETIYIDGVQLQSGTNLTAYNPGGAIQLNGTVNSPVVFQNSSNSADALKVIDSAGSLVAGIDTANHTLSVQAGTDGKTLGGELYMGDFSSGWTSTGWNTTAISSATHNAGNTSLLSNSSLTLTVGSTYRFNFNLSGTCGTPSDTLSVTNGGQNIVYLYGNNCSGTYSYVFTAATTAGPEFQPSTNWAGTIDGISVVELIGTNNPALVVSNTTGASVLEVRASSSQTNVYIGFSSGTQNSSAGLGNTAVGYSSLLNNIDGNTNSAFGEGSLTANTSGSDNSAFGAGSLTNNSTGYGNTAVGSSSLLFNTTGYGNTGIGVYSLQANTTGYANTALGISSLTTNTTGINNTGLGQGSLQSNTTGSNNTAVGQQSLAINDSGSYNTAIGIGSLGLNMSGSNNVALGTYSLINNTTGSTNSALGYSAGADDSLSLFSQQANLNNTTTIGAYSVAQASNSLILGGAGADAVNVGIGTTIPLNTFSVSPVQYSTGTISQTASTTVVGSGTTFTASMVGDILIYADGTQDTVTGFTDATHLTVTTSRTHASSAYRLHSPGFNVTSTGNAFVQNTSTTAFRVQNAKGANVLNVDTTNGQVILGNYNGGTNPVNGRLIVNNSSNANPITIVSGITTGTGYTLTLPTALGASGDCLKDTTGAGVLGFGSCGAAGGTLQGAYNAYATAPASIVLDSTRQGLLVRDNATPIGSTLFAVQNNAGTTSYLSVAGSGNVGINNASAPNEFSVNTPATADAATVGLIASNAATNAALVLQGFGTNTVPNQTTSIFKVQDSTGTTIAKIDQFGGGMFKGITSSATGTNFGNTNNIIKASVNSVPVLQVQAYNSSQSGNLFQLQNSDAVILSQFDANGQLSSYGTNTYLTGLASPVPTLTTGTAGTTYYYTVTATNAQGETDQQTSIGTTTNTVTISWAQIPGATGYKVYRNTSNSFTAGSLLAATITNGSTISFTDTGAATTAGLPPASPTGTGLQLQAWDNQTNPIFQAYSGNGTTYVKINESGRGNGILDVSAPTGTGSGYPLIYSAQNATYSYAMYGKNQGIAIKGETTGSTAFGTTGNNAGVLGLASGGTAGIGVEGQSKGGASGLFQAYAGTNTAATLVSKMYTGQTTNNLFELQNASGNAMTKFNANGDLQIGGTNSANSTTAFQVQNATGGQLLNVDTTNSALAFGSNTKLGISTLPGTLSWDNGDQNEESLVRVYAPVNATVQSISLYIGGPNGTSAAPNNKYQVAIYADSAGTPGSLVASTGDNTLTAAAAGTGAWNTATISATLTGGQYYWIGYNTNTTDNNANVLAFNTDFQTLTSNTWKANAYGSAWTNPYGTSTNGSNNPFVMYMNVTPGSANILTVDATNGVNVNNTNLNVTGDLKVSQDKTSATQSIGYGTYHDAFSVDDGNSTIVFRVDTYNQRVGVRVNSSWYAGTGGTLGTFTVQAGSTDPAISVINNAQTANLFTLGNTGALTLQNSTNSTSALTVKNVAGSSIFTVDTTTARGLVKVALGNTASTNAVCSTLANGTAPTANTTYTLVDCNAAPAADYAENYPVASGVSYGDIVATGTNMVNTYDESNGTVDWSTVKGQVTQLVLSTAPYQANAIGIVSNNHGQFTSAGNNILAQDNPMPVALNGRVPVNISPSSAPIIPGDYLTTSSDPGKAQKATGPGYVIGKALAAWSPASGQTSVMVYVEPGYYAGMDTVNYIQNGGNATLTNLTINSTATVNNLNATGPVTFSGTLVVTDDATFTGTLTVKDVQVDNITINGHIITAGNVPTVTVGTAAGTADTTNNITAPVATVDGNDTAGTITIVAGASTSSGDVASVTFNNSFGKAPRVILTPVGSDSAKLQVYIAGTTTTTFSIGTNTAPSAGTTYQYNYQIMQ